MADNTSMQHTQHAAGISLLEFTQAISRHINANESLKNLWVIAELGDFRFHGIHAYGQLIEKDAAGNTVARINATIWHDSLTRIKEKFNKATGQDIKPGMKLMLRVSAAHSPAYGLSANISDVDPAYTLGDMERLRREILMRLKQEGVFDLNRKLEISVAPQRIAVISSQGAAGYDDFINQLSLSGFTFYPLLYQASMQGERTVPTILEALDRIEMAPDFWDCVVIIRGGGATSDLNSFDNYDLARRVATYPIPVIVGIGHERDNTVLDYVANTRCKTPTAVAAFLIDRLARAELRAADLMRAVAERTQNLLTLERQRLAYAAAMLPVAAPSRLQTERHRLATLSAELQRNAACHVRTANSHLGEITTSLASAAASHLSRQHSMLDSLPALLRQLSSQRLDTEKRRLDSDRRLIDVLNPEATMRRGYSITRVNGKAIHAISDVAEGDMIETMLPDGSILSEVEARRPTKDIQ